MKNRILTVLAPSAVALLVALLVARPCAAQRAQIKTSDDAKNSRTSRNAVAPDDIAAQNPFAARANRASAGQAAETSSSPSARVVPRAASEPLGVDLLVLRDGARLEGTLKRLSGFDGASFEADKRVQVVPTSKIERIEASVSSTFCQANDALETGRRTSLDSEYRRAYALFKEARSTASRQFEKEWATAKIVETLLALGRHDEAVVEFFILCRIDPYTAFLPSIPLRWRNQRSSQTDSNAVRNAEESAAQWLGARENPSGKPNPVGRLLAASVLLRSARHSADAAAALRELCVCEAPDGASEEAVETCRVVSLLANAQLWRDDVLKTPERKNVDRWIRVVELLPNAYKPEPASLVGLGAKALGSDEEAARFFLIGTLSLDRDLSRECAANCADALERLGKTKEAEELRASSSRISAQNAQL